ncbi:MAG: phosphotransferase [Candidatus Acidiferrales bacterium]
MQTVISGAPKEARWLRAQPRRTLPAPLVERIVHTAFPRSRVLDIQPLRDGLRNANFKLQLDSPPDPIVLRIYEHDASICQKEVDLLNLVARSVPVPEIIHAESRGTDDIPPFALLHFVEGISFRDLTRAGDADAIAQAARSAGETLAAIGRTTFSISGWLALGPAVGTPLLDGADPVPRFVDLCLAAANLQRRMPADLRKRTHASIWSHSPNLGSLDDDACLVHGDFGKRNLLVRNVEGKCTVVAVLDWEFAVSGSPLADLGHFLRYERISRPLVEPHFSNGYLFAAGKLPQNWRQLARLVDLAALCESLTHDDLPDAVVAELIELIRATVENRDPQFA